MPGRVFGLSDNVAKARLSLALCVMWVHVFDQKIIGRVGSTPRKRQFQTGFVPRWPLAYRAYNLMLGLMVLVALAPLMAGFALVLRLTQGPDVLLRAQRVGQGQRPFTLYRFATVEVDQSNKRLRPTALGLYLNQTGFVALPQLLNVIKGDMNIIGPLPVRAAIAQIETARDPHYACRFAVKPGLISHTDVVMSPTTGQRVKAKLTYQLCHTAVNLPVEFALMLRIAGAYLRETIRVMRPGVTPSGYLAEARRRAQDLHLELETPQGRYPVYAFAKGLLMTPHVVTGGPGHLTFAVGPGNRKAKILLSRLSYLQGQTVFQYDAVDDNSAHLVSRYLRNETLLKPGRPTWRRPRLSDLQYEIALHEAEHLVPVDRERR